MIFTLGQCVVFVMCCCCSSWKPEGEACRPGKHFSSCSAFCPQVSWRAVFWGLGLEFLLGLFVIRTTPGTQAFQWLGDQVQVLHLLIPSCACTLRLPGKAECGMGREHGRDCMLTNNFVQDWREASSFLVFCSSPDPSVWSPFQAVPELCGFGTPPVSPS